MRSIFFAIGVSSVIVASSQVAIVVASYTRTRCAFHGAFGGTNRASQLRQQRKVNNKRMLGEFLSVRSKESFNELDELSSKAKQGSKESNNAGPSQLHQ